MPTAVPDRYRLELRLGRDGDIEEWLASDTSLDRPVVVRSLGPESSQDRRRQFVSSVSDAAKAHHPHLATVFVAEEVSGGAYSVVEWNGGTSVADRVGAGNGIGPDEFLPNASGLSGALAALHAAGAVHGSIDLSAIYYSEAHPAKLGAFGRPFQGTMDSDVRALATALETALTGEPPGGPPPSESIDGLSPIIDQVLRAGQSGRYTAGELEKALRAAPTPRSPKPEPKQFSRRLLLTAMGLVVLAVGLVGFGALFGSPTDPIIPTPITTRAETPTSASSTTLPGAISAVITSVVTHDPFGGGGENDGSIANVTDGDVSTLWTTERYQDPMELIKPGVGVVAAVSGSPSQLQLVGFSEGTAFEIRWSDRVLDDPEEWERIAAGRAPAGATSLDLPIRRDGFWMVWMLELPIQADGTYQSAIAELRLSP